MYDTQLIADRIRKQAKQKNFKLNVLLKELNLGVNAVSHLSNGQEMSYLSFANIADRLNCSTDYLLGRTDTPTGTYSISNNNTTVNGTQANVINNAEIVDELTDEFIRVFKTLNFDDKVSVMQYVKDIKKAPSDDGE